MRLALPRPDGVGYGHDGDGKDPAYRTRPVIRRSFACTCPDVAQFDPAAAKPPGAFTRHHLSDSTVIGTDERTTGECGHPGDDDSGNGCRWTGPHTGVLRRRPRSSRNAWRAGSQQSPRSKRPIGTVYEAADGRAAVMRPGRRCAVLTGSARSFRHTVVLCHRVSSTAERFCSARFDAPLSVAGEWSAINARTSSTQCRSCRHRCPE